MHHSLSQHVQHATAVAMLMKHQHTCINTVKASSSPPPHPPHALAGRSSPAGLSIPNIFCTITHTPKYVTYLPGSPLGPASPRCSRLAKSSAGVEHAGGEGARRRVRETETKNKKKLCQKKKEPQQQCPVSVARSKEMPCCTSLRYFATLAYRIRVCRPISGMSTSIPRQPF